MHSQIIPEGFGLYVGGECLTTQTICSEVTTPYSFQSFSQYAQVGVAADQTLSGASVEFKILGAGQTLYDLNASTDLVYDPSTGTNVFVDNIAQASAALDSFQLQTIAGSGTAHGFNWGATDINVMFPSGFILAPGASTTLTYETVTRTFSRTDCLDYTACVIGYSAFGDPIGMSGGVNHSASVARQGRQASSTSPVIPGLTFSLLGFATPTFHDGSLNYDPIPNIPTIPEPATWGLMLIGFGMVGYAARHRRAGMLSV